MTVSDFLPWPRRVIVTGASGHLGGWIASILGSGGVFVTAAAGPGEDIDAVAQRLAAAGVPQARLRMVEADLLGDRCWAAIMAGQDALIHVAAPIPLHLPEADGKLLEQARGGTRRVLAAAAEAGIRRVVATSSIMAALYDSARPRGHVVTEADWSAPGREPMTAYAVAKTAAEREAWQVSARLGLDLTVINPGILLGPSLTGAISPSLNLFRELLAGRATIAPRILLPLVDVRDVAWLHIAALLSDAAIGERIFAVAEQLWFGEVIRLVRSADPSLSGLPEPRPIEDRLACQLADAFSILRYLRYDIGDGRPIHRGKAKKLLGIDWRPMKETLAETAGYLRGFEAQRLVA